MNLNLSLLLSLVAAAAEVQQPAQAVKVVRVAVINGKKYEMREIKPTPPAHASKPHWNKAAFSAPEGPVQHGKGHGHHHRHGRHPHHGHSRRHPRHRHGRRHPRHRHGRRHPHRGVPRRANFVKVITRTERIMVDAHMRPIFKEHGVVTNLYLKAPNKPFQKLSTSRSKNVLLDIRKQAAASMKAAAMRGPKKAPKLTEKEFTAFIFLLGMSSMLALVAFFKGAKLLLRSDETKRGGYAKLSGKDENKILLETEEKGIITPAEV